jgi:hypothetical protein
MDLLAGACMIGKAPVTAKNGTPQLLFSSPARNGAKEFIPRPFCDEHTGVAVFGVTFIYYPGGQPSMLYQP